LTGDVREVFQCSRWKCTVDAPIWGKVGENRGTA